MKAHLLILVPVFLLAACGSEQSKTSAEISGKLHAGRIQGVAWRTPTRSGTTDAIGKFAYLPGESVTFSVGGVELGTAPGAPDITLFTLAGLAPPATERELRRELDLAMRMATPFTRAINLDLFLLALDADGNPDNGLDVRNRAAALAGVSLEFDQRIWTFGTELYATVPSLNQSIPVFKPVSHLFASLGLRIPVHARVQVLTEQDGNPAISRQSFSYRADGSLESEDGDRDGDGVADSHAGYEYDAFGRITKTDVRQDVNLDHVDDQRYTTSIGFDAHGKIVEYVEEQQNSAPGPSQTWTLVEREVDEFARPTREVMDIDFGPDGTVDARQVDSVVYEANRTVSTTTTDADNDGVDDWFVRTTETTDAQRRVLSRVIEQDYDADGAMDSVNTETFAYDDVARTERYVAESDVNADGTTDWRTVESWQLDAADNVIAQTSAVEPFADGIARQIRSVSREFDDARRVTRSTTDDDDDADGLADSRQLDMTTYDELGNVLYTTSDYDLGVDGVTELHFDEGSEYGADGELLSSASHLDLSGDGLTDIRMGTTVENTRVDDGVLLLTNWYVRTRF